MKAGGYKFHFKRRGPPRVVVSRNALSLTISIRRREIWYRIQLLRQICAARSGWGKEGEGGRGIHRCWIWSIGWHVDGIRGWLTDRFNWSRNCISFKNNVCFLNFLQWKSNHTCMYVSFDERLEFSSIFRFNSEIRLQLSIMYIIIQQKCKYVYNYRTSVTSVLRIVDCLLRKTLVVSEIENFKDESPRRNFYAENTFFPYL